MGRQEGVSRQGSMRAHRHRDEYSAHRGQHAGSDGHRLSPCQGVTPAPAPTGAWLLRVCHEQVGAPTPQVRTCALPLLFIPGLEGHAIHVTRTVAQAGVGERLLPSPFLRSDPEP